MVMSGRCRIMDIQDLTKLEVLDLSKIGRWTNVISNEFNEPIWGGIKKLIVPVGTKMLRNFGNGFSGLEQLIILRNCHIIDSFNDCPNLKIIKINHLRIECDTNSITIESSFRRTAYDLLDTAIIPQINNSFSENLILPDIYSETGALGDTIEYYKSRGEIRTSVSNLSLMKSSDELEPSSGLCTKYLTLELNCLCNIDLLDLTEFVSSKYIKYLVLDTTKLPSNGLKNLIKLICNISFPNLKYLFIPREVCINFNSNARLGGYLYGGTTLLCESKDSIKGIDFTLYKVQCVSGIDEARQLIDEHIKQEAKIVLSMLPKLKALGISASLEEYHPSFISRRKEWTEISGKLTNIIENNDELLAIRSIDFIETFGATAIDYSSKYGHIHSSTLFEIEENDTRPHVEVIREMYLDSQGACLGSTLDVRTNGVPSIRRECGYFFAKTSYPRINGFIPFTVGDIILIFNVRVKICNKIIDGYCTISGKPITLDIESLIFRKLTEYPIIYIEYSDGSKILDLTDEEIEKLYIYEYEALEYSGNGAEYHRVSYYKKVTIYLYDSDRNKILALTGKIYSMANLGRILCYSLRTIYFGVENRSYSYIAELRNTSKLEIVDIVSLKDFREKYSRVYSELSRVLNIGYLAYKGNRIE